MKTNKLAHKITVPTAKGQTQITVALHDDCRNVHEHFSVTAIIYERNHAGRLRGVGGGCCHEHILDLRPEFAPFVALHLSDQDGVPTYAVADGWYWFQGAFPATATDKYHGGTGSNARTPEQCLAILTDHLRATPEDIAAITQANPRTVEEFQFALETLEFPRRWKAEAKAAIAELERLTGGTFKSAATRKAWKPLTPEQVSLIAERRASGYYSPEQTAARDEQARLDRIAALVEKAKADHAATIAKANKELAVDLIFARRGMENYNFIYYNHTGELTCNWTSTEKIWTESEFNAFRDSLTPGELPDGVQLVFRPRPRY